MSCLLVSIKWCQAYAVQPLRPRQEVVPTQRLQKEQAEEAIFFPLCQEETEGQLNLPMDNLYQSPH